MGEFEKTMLFVLTLAALVTFGILVATGVIDVTAWFDRPPTHPVIPQGLPVPVL